jgi:hypothetical protein
MSSIFPTSSASNQFTGALPTQVGLLTSLLEFGLGEYIEPIFYLVRGLNFDLIRLSVCHHLYRILHESSPHLPDNNQFTGALPTQVGLLTDLEWFDLCEYFKPVFFFCAD